MIICRTKNALTHALKALRSENSIGFVPTMGALHEGHLGLVKLAKQHSDCVVVSVFVNPTQFAPHEDFDSYPRNLEGDAAKLKSAGASVVYFPEESDIYPNGKMITIKAGEAAQGLEADFRPTHFDGVTTVVHTLFSQVQPDIAVFGEKDFQQLQVIKEMCERENLDVKIIGAPIARDEFGLALSSRNAYLSSEEIEIARMLNQVVYKAAFDLKNGVSEDIALSEAEAALKTCGFDKIDYVRQWNGRVLAAAYLGKTRLIDNAEIA